MTDTNRTIAEAMGWTAFQERERHLYGRPPERKTRNILTERRLPDYEHDANALIPALDALCPGWLIEHMPDSEGEEPDQYEATCYARKRLAAGLTFCDAGCAMILAVLAEKAEAAT